MSSSNLTKLPIDSAQFRMAFDRDLYNEDAPEHWYLDKQSGAIYSVYENDEDAEGISPESNKAERDRIAKEPGRFLEIPGREHAEHHDALKEFISSDYAQDDDLQGSVPVYSGSIGGWLCAVEDPDIKRAYRECRDARLREQGEEFLKQHGIDPEWK